MEHSGKNIAYLNHLTLTCLLFKSVKIQHNQLLNIKTGQDNIYG